MPGEISETRFTKFLLFNSDFKYSKLFFFLLIGLNLEFLPPLPHPKKNFQSSCIVQLYLSISLSAYLSSFLFYYFHCLSVCLSVYLSVCVSICIYLSICLSVCLPSE